MQYNSWKVNENHESDLIPFDREGRKSQKVRKYLEYSHKRKVSYSRSNITQDINAH